MIYSRRGPLRRVVLSVTLLAGVLASVGVFFACACKYRGEEDDEGRLSRLSCKTGIANGDVSVTTTQTYPTPVAAGEEVHDQVVERDHGRGRVGHGCIRRSPKRQRKGYRDHGHGSELGRHTQTLNIAGKGLAESGHDQQLQQFPDLYAGQWVTYTTPSFTAGKKGTDKISAGDDDANITIYNSSGSQVTTTTADCTPVGTPAVIATITVT